MEQLHLLIFGRVQRVGFRRFVLHQAEQLKLSGWVRNNDDGTVEIFVQGLSDALSLFVECCRKGPLFSSVVEVRFLPVEDFCLRQVIDGKFLILKTN